MAWIAMSGAGLVDSTIVDSAESSAIADWLNLPDAAERLDIPVTRVRQLIRDHRLLAERRGGVLYIPAAFFQGNEVVKGLAGLLTLLMDAGYDDEAALRWLFTADDSLPGTPVEALADNRMKEVRRRAQALAF